MIARLSGKLLEISPAHLIVDCGGVGYLASISLATYAMLQNKEHVDLYTKMIVREDAQLLFAFANVEEKELFELLILVNGVGPSSAIALLSSLDIASLRNAIVNDDAKTIQSVKGIGAKTAQRIIIDLRDKIKGSETAYSLDVNIENKIKFDSLIALEVLGLTKLNAERIVEKLLKEKAYKSVEELVREALKNI